MPFSKPKEPEDLGPETEEEKRIRLNIEEGHRKIRKMSDEERKAWIDSHFDADGNYKKPDLDKTTDKTTANFMAKEAKDAKDEEGSGEDTFYEFYDEDKDKKIKVILDD